MSFKYIILVCNISDESFTYLFFVFYLKYIKRSFDTFLPYFFFMPLVFIPPYHLECTLGAPRLQFITNTSFLIGMNVRRNKYRSQFLKDQIWSKVNSKYRTELTLLVVLVTGMVPVFCTIVGTNNTESEFHDFRVPSTVSYV